MKTPKHPLHKLLLTRGLAESEAEAKGLILAGKVSTDNRCLDKAGELFADDIPLHVKGKKPFPWVSRGGVKLEHGLAQFNMTVRNKTIVDLGSSTGGFTDVCLHGGASKIYAVDVGYGELAYKLMQDDRVQVQERTNARALDATIVPDVIDGIVCDISFARLQQVLPAAMALPKSEGCFLIALIKPQFEVEKHEVGEGGIITDSALHERVVARTVEWMNLQAGWQAQGVCESPITGAKGNVEFLLAATWQGG